MSVRKRGEHWHFDFQINGVRYRESIPAARTKKEAQQAEASARLAIFQGRYGGWPPPTGFEKFVAQVYLPWAQANKKTYLDDVAHCRSLCKAFEGKTLDQITPFMIETHKRNRAATPTRNGTPRQPASVNRELAVLSRIFSMAIDNGLVENNPCKRVKRFRMDNLRNRYLSVEEETKLLNSCTGLRAHLRDLIMFAIYTGMRKGEILNLKWSQVDFERRMVLVTQTKSGKDRSIPMSDEIFQILFSRKKTAAWVFTHPYHPSQRLTEFKRAWQAACLQAGVFDLRFHDLRHTAATRMAEAGTDAFTIAAILGHSTIQMSARYTHATDRGKRQALESLGHYGRTVTELSQKKKGGG